MSFTLYLPSCSLPRPTYRPSQVWSLKSFTQHFFSQRNKKEPGLPALVAATTPAAFHANGKDIIHSPLLLLEHKAVNTGPLG